MKKRKVLVNIIKLKCPRCHTGDLFTIPGLFVARKILAMPHKCPHCGQDFTIEPGFYSAALWISYPIVLLLIVLLSLFGFYLINTLNISYKMVVPVLIAVCFLFQIPIMRIARAILINVVIAYEEREIE